MTTTILKCSICGTTQNIKGKPFTKQGLADHRKSHYTQPVHERGPMTPDFDFEFTDDMDDDLPDGAYFALAHEMGEF